MKPTTLLSKMAIVFLFFLGTTAFSQNLVPAENLTPALLKQTFENAYIKVLETQDGFIKVQDTYDVFIDIDPSKRYVCFSSSYSLVAGTSPKDALELMNMLNTDIILVKSYYIEKNNSINYIAYFWTERGFSPQSMVSAFKMYVSALTLSLQKDTKKIIK
ncbi:hypothetical protein [Flavobacterium lindanitolerans]|uniref:hypothetical protein n=1 Tax=Flavobacterium lindanitolerans TaxID=428988 RepID=UPI0028092202|nr:hypothetical protein [Flavobacterium lindanitolerans]MDQ7960054.1 hypothetical protein [Flavobacterium lindanitolerans]